MIQEVVTIVMITILALMAITTALGPMEELPPPPIFFQGKVSINKEGLVRLRMKSLPEDQCVKEKIKKD